MIGQPSYVELGVPDVDKARHFYRSVLGWAPPGESGPVNIVTGSLDVGMHGGDPSAEMLLFFTVADLDESINSLLQAGGRTQSDVVVDDGFGRFVVCSDDQGVRFALRQLPTDERASAS